MKVNTVARPQNKITTTRTLALKKANELFESTSYSIVKISSLTGISVNSISKYILSLHPGKTMKELNAERTQHFEDMAFEMLKDGKHSIEYVSEVTGINKEVLIHKVKEIKAAELYLSNRYSFAEIQHMTGISPFLIRKHLSTTLNRIPRS